MAVVFWWTGGELAAQRRGTPPAATVAAAPIVQFNGNTIMMPQKPPFFSRYSGLQISVDPRWVNNYGYRPVEVTLTLNPARKPSTKARRVRIQIHYGWDRELDVEQEIELPAGATSASALVSLPGFQQANSSFWWDVWVDGNRDKDLSVDRMTTIPLMGNFGSTSGLSFLVAGPAERDRSLVTTSSMELDVLTLELASFPERWLDYSALDVIALTLGELQDLKQNRPKSYEAILAWARAGGQLWVCEIGKDYQELPALSKLLGLSESLLVEEAKSTDADAAKMEKDKKESESTPPEKVPTSPATRDGGTPEEATVASAESGSEAPNPTEFEMDDEQPNTSFGWRPLRLMRQVQEGRVAVFIEHRTGRRRTVRDPDLIDRLEQDPNYTKAEERFDAASGVTVQRIGSDSSPWYVEQRLGLGTVRAFQGANEVAAFAHSQPAANPNVGNPAAANTGLPETFTRPLQMGLRGTERWDSRHGMTPDSGNLEFAKFFVPNVGRAPVVAFEVLITVFVLLIGPVNYLLLKRAKRLHLMVLTVPLAAVVTTLTLFMYAILADGFATRVRARSFTVLDQRTGDAACWTWLSYYSGLAPGDGLRMPADSVIYPIRAAWAGDSDMAQMRSLVWERDEALLKDGWLHSRTPTQYLTIRSRKSPYKLEVEQASDRVRVRNKLGAKIEMLVLIGEDGAVYVGENIGPDALVPLTPAQRDKAIARLSALVRANQPTAPEELATSDAQLSAMTSGSRYRRYGRYTGQFGGRLLDNLAGSAIAELAGHSAQPGLDLPPRSYVAITESGPEVETGIPQARPEASFHMIEGRW